MLASSPQGLGLARVVIALPIVQQMTPGECGGPAKLLKEFSIAHAIKEVQMSDSVYKVVTLIGTSAESWEKAAKAAVEAASHSLRELRIAEVVKQDMVVTDGKVEAYRTKVRLSFKYEGNE